MAEIMRIKALPDEVISQIAAGEVVERPAAAVKELVENSMDAGATAITVDIREGGVAYIRVTDNGSGIDAGDMRLAFARHATSKLRTAQELTGVKTLGFRGEALSSIAAVARVTLKTRARGAQEGVEAVCEGGEMTDIRPAACPEGTAVTVRDLFFNAPVRRKFLKKPQAEAALVGDLLARLILSRPDVSFRFSADGKSVYFSPGDGLQKSAVMSVYGMDLIKSLREVSGQGAGMLLSGMLGVGDASRATRAHQFFFLNGRAIKSALLSSAVEAACRQRVTIGRFPFCVLHLHMPFELADVNVHPNKWEVRFQNEGAVAEAVTGILTDALTEASPLAAPPPLFVREEPPAQSVPEKPLPEPVIERTSAFVFRETPTPAHARVTPPPPPPPPTQPAKAPEQTRAEPACAQSEAREMRVLGVAFDTYILIECSDTLYLCDQHAAHERILFDRLMRQTESGGASQMLLVPQILALSVREEMALETYGQTLARAGFDVTGFGQRAARLCAVPMLLGQPRAEGCLRDALEQLAASAQLTDDERVTRVMQIACKHAVKGGEKPPADAIFALVEQLIEQNVMPTCPHGRPLLVAVTRRELEKRFARIQG